MSPDSPSQRTYKKTYKVSEQRNNLLSGYTPNLLCEIFGFRNIKYVIAGGTCCFNAGNHRLKPGSEFTVSADEEVINDFEHRLGLLSEQDITRLIFSR